MSFARLLCRVFTLLAIVAMLASCSACPPPAPIAQALGECENEMEKHDHTPLHDGQVGMIADYHIEVVAEAATVRVYLSDECRKSIPPVSGGSVTVQREAQENMREAPLRVVGVEGASTSHLEASFADFELKQPFFATVKTRVGPFPIEMTFSFPPALPEGGPVLPPIAPKLPGVDQ